MPGAIVKTKKFEPKFGYDSIVCGLCSALTYRKLYMIYTCLNFSSTLDNKRYKIDHTEHPQSWNKKDIVIPLRLRSGSLRCGTRQRWAKVRSPATGIDNALPSRSKSAFDIDSLNSAAYNGESCANSILLRLFYNLGASAKEELDGPEQTHGLGLDCTLHKSPPLRSSSSPKATHD